MGQGRRQALVVAVCMGLLALPACSSSSGGGGGTSGSVTPSATATGTTAAAASPSATVTYKPGDPLGEGAWAKLGKVTVRSPQEQAVVDAYLRMDQVVLQAFNTRVLDEPTLDKVLEGDQLQRVRKQILWRHDQKLWTVGQETLNVLSVQIAGATATVRVCNFDGTSEVGVSGRNMVQPPGSVGAILTFLQRDGAWRESAAVADTAKCDALKL